MDEKLQERVAALEAKVAALRDEGMLRTRSLQIVDETGNVRAALGAGDDGVVRFLQTDANGELRIGLAVGREGKPALVFFDAERAARLEIGLSPEGEPSVSLLGPDETTRLQARIHPDGRAGLMAYDGAGELRAVLGTAADGSGAIGTFGEQQ